MTKQTIRIIGQNIKKGIEHYNWQSGMYYLISAIALMMFCNFIKGISNDK